MTGVGEKVRLHHEHRPQLARFRPRARTQVGEVKIAETDFHLSDSESTSASIIYAISLESSPTESEAAR